MSGRLLDAAEQRARELLVFAHGFDAAGGGNAELARRARMAARDVLKLAEMLAAERSARVAIQERAERLQGIVGKGAYQAAVAEAAHPTAAIDWPTNGRNR